MRLPAVCAADFTVRAGRPSNPTRAGERHHGARPGIADAEHHGSHADTAANQDACKGATVTLDAQRATPQVAASRVGRSLRWPPHPNTSVRRQRKKEKQDGLMARWVSQRASRSARRFSLVALLAVLGAAAYGGYALATSGPATPTITAKPVNPTASTSASFSFTDSTSGVTFKCSLDAAAYTACTSPKPYSGLTAASHTFSVQAVSGSNTSSAASYTWTIDTTAPTATITFPANGATYNARSVRRRLLAGRDLRHREPTHPGSPRCASRSSATRPASTGTAPASPSRARRSTRPPGRRAGSTAWLCRLTTPTRCTCRRPTRSRTPRPA